MIKNLYRKKKISNANQITAKIESSRLMSSDSLFSSQYVIYSISFSTHSHTWRVMKRYSDFKALDSTLQEMKIGPMPEFPPKRLNALSQSTLDERRETLEIYLNTLFFHYNLEMLQPLMQFIRISKEAFELYFKCNSLQSSHALNDNSSLLTSNSSFNSNELKHNLIKNYYISLYQFRLYDNNEDSDDEQSANEFVFEEFLRNMEETPENKINLINEFEAYLKNGEAITYTEINTLFFGADSNGRQLKGVLHHCGRIRENKLGAQRCLQFVNSLISCETNLSNELYVSAFKKASMEDLAAMELTQHLMNDSLNVSCIACEVLFILSNFQLEVDESIRMLINDSVAEAKYTSWIEKTKL